MQSLLDFFSVSDAFPLILLICVLRWVGGKAAGGNPLSGVWAGGVAIISFVLYLTCSIARARPDSPPEYLTLSFQALLAMGTAHGIASVLIPIGQFLHRHLWKLPRERDRAAAANRARTSEAQERERQQDRMAQERKAEEQRRTEEAAANRPPPPTREQRMAAAKERYDTALGMLQKAALDEQELGPAKQKIKQQYLRELDEAMR